MDDLLRCLRAAAEQTRLRLLVLCADSDLTVSELVHIVGQSQPRVSRHLKVLTDAGLLERMREGSWVFYRVPASELSGGLIERLLELIPEDDAQFQSDRARLVLVKTDRLAAAAAYFKQVAGDWHRLRSLHVEEPTVEAAITNLADRGNRGSLLDIGTGTGRMLELLGPYFDEAEGVDLSHEMLAIARSNLDSREAAHCRVRHGNMYMLPYPDDSFDLITIHQVLHYAGEPERVIAEAERVLRPGGRVVVVDFAPHDLEELRDRHQHRRLGFADEEFAEWARQSGLNAGPVAHLTGGTLTVVVWHGDKAGGRHAKDNAPLTISARAGAGADA